MSDTPWAEALEEVDYRWHLYTHAKTLPEQGEALIALSNAWSDMRSWHPGFDGDHGTLPWEREADDG